MRAEYKKSSGQYSTKPLFALHGGIYLVAKLLGKIKTLRHRQKIHEACLWHEQTKLACLQLWRRISYKKF